MITLKKREDDSNIGSYCVTNDARHPRMCMRKKTKQRHMSKNGPFVSFCPFWPGFGLSGLVMAFLTCVWPFWHSIWPYYLRKSCHLCSVIELSTWFTREFAFDLHAKSHLAARVTKDKSAKTVNKIYSGTSSETKGQIVGARESLNGGGGEYGAKKRKQRREEPLGTMSYQTSSKRSPPFWLLTGARKL